MPNYRRAQIESRLYFFTVVLADRDARLLVDEIDRLRQCYRLVQRKMPFETIAICVLPDHIHALWKLPAGDANYSIRWNMIKSSFTRGLEPSAPRTASQLIKREKGHLAATILGAFDSRRCRSRAEYRLHTLQSS
jgi:putative transposase